MSEDNNDEVSLENVYQIVEKVRYRTDISHELSCQSTFAVLESIASLVPASVTPLIENIIQKLDHLEAPESIIDETIDMSRLTRLATFLNDVKNDAQQRSWELIDDLHMICEKLTEFNSILEDADEAIVKRFLFAIDHYIVGCLAEYYQMENRWQIKILLLKTFGLLCPITKPSAVILLNSVLPLEIARDIQYGQNDASRLADLLRVLTMICSVGEPFPVIHFDTLGKNFILFLLNIIETPSYSDNSSDQDVISDAIRCILAYNLQFMNNGASENITIAAISELNNSKNFTENLLLLLNRGVDPLYLPHQDLERPNSLLKMFTDIFSSMETTNLFYRNDIKVLVDIVMRQLTDMSPNDKGRCQWLGLLKQILQSNEASMFDDRLTELQTCMHRIRDEDSNEDDMKILIEDIINCLK